MSEPVRGLVVAHGPMAEGLVAAVQRIAGVEADALQALSNEGLGPEGLRAALEARLGAAPAVVFVDLPSGSCALEARRVARARPATAVVCGVNLPMLLDFVFHRDLPLETLVPRLLERGRGGILGEVAAESADADRSAPR